MERVRDGRPVPKVCLACRSKKIAKHCPIDSGACCSWVRCKDCEAVSGYKHTKGIVGWKPISYRIEAAA